MAYDGAGNYSLPAGADVKTGDTILASDLNIPLDDIEAALSQVLLRSGVAPMTGNLNMGGHTIINAGGVGGTLLTVADTGTSGHKIPYLDQAHTWSGTNNVFTGSVALNGNATIGDTPTDVVFIKGTQVHAFSSGLLDNADATAWRASLGLGTAAVASGTAAQYNIGTSGATVPLLNASNTHSGANTFTAGNTFTGGNVFNGTNAFTGANNFNAANNFIGSNTFSVTQLSNTGANDLYGWIFTRSTALLSSGIFINNTGVDAGDRKQIVFGANGSTCGSITCDIIGTSGDTEYKTTSDDRFKHGATPLEPGDVIDRLAPIRYRLGSDDGPEKIGFSAQELYAVVPQAATPGTGEPGEESFVPWMRSIGVLEPILVAEVKALRARVASLEAHLEALEARFDAFAAQ